MSATTFMSVSSLMLDFQTHGTAEGFLCHRISQGPGVSSSPSAVRPGVIPITTPEQTQSARPFSARPSRSGEGLSASEFIYLQDA